VAVAQSCTAAPVVIDSGGALSTSKVRKIPPGSVEQPESNTAPAMDKTPTIRIDPPPNPKPLFALRLQFLRAEGESYNYCSRGCPRQLIQILFNPLSYLPQLRFWLRAIALVTDVALSKILRQGDAISLAKTTNSAFS
jgi:hypothetical protein